MKYVFLIFISLFSSVLYANENNGGISLSNTRVIFDSGKKNAVFTVKNSSVDQVWLISSHVSEYNKPKIRNQNFIITPPLYRLNGKQSIQLRINVIDTDSLPKDIESVFSINSLAIPAESIENTVKENVVRISYSINNSIKLFFRPEKLNDFNLVEDAHKSLEFKIKNNDIYAYNKSSYFITFAIINSNAKDKNYRMIAPKNSIIIDEKVKSDSISYQTINDLGGISGPYNYKF